MSILKANTCMLDPPGKNPATSTGFVGQDEEHGAGPSRDRPRNPRRPLSMAWISDELLAETIDVWSQAYGRPVSEDEAVEILMNVKRLGEVLLRTRQEGSAP